jgi:hypothetical protein
MEAQNQEFTEIFATLSNVAQKLLVNSTSFSPDFGEKKGKFLAVSALTDEQFEKASQELIERGLMRRGNLANEPLKANRPISRFLDDPNGTNFAVPEDVREAILTKIFHIPKNLDLPLPR